MIKRVKLMGVLAAAGVLAVGGVVLMPSPAPAEAAGFAAAGNAIDGGHSSVVFKIMHKKKAPFYGVFKDVSGSFNLDAADAAKSSLEVKVKADSVDTRIGGRDTHVKSADFLSAKEFPEITFKSTAVKKTGDKAFEVTGDMTFRGVTKPVTAQVTQTDDAGKGLEAKFQIKRSEFGNNSAAGKDLGDEVDFIVALEGK
jgi:polyisoprenoid-binding protein YceI